MNNAECSNSNDRTKMDLSLIDPPSCNHLSLTDSISPCCAVLDKGVALSCLFENVLLYRVAHLASTGPPLPVDAKQCAIGLTPAFEYCLSVSRVSDIHLELNNLLCSAVKQEAQHYYVETRIWDQRPMVSPDRGKIFSTNTMLERHSAMIRDAEIHS